MGEGWLREGREGGEGRKEGNIERCWLKDEWRSIDLKWPKVNRECGPTHPKRASRNSQVLAHGHSCWRTAISVFGSS